VSIQKPFSRLRAGKDVQQGAVFQTPESKLFSKIIFKGKNLALSGIVFRPQAETMRSMFTLQ